MGNDCVYTTYGLKFDLICPYCNYETFEFFQVVLKGDAIKVVDQRVMTCDRCKTPFVVIASLNPATDCRRIEGHYVDH